MATELDFVMDNQKLAILGLFEYVDDLTRAIHDLKHHGYDDMVVFSPIPLHDVEHALEHGREKRPSTLAAAIKAFREKDIHVIRFTLLGGVLGALAAWALAIGTALSWPIPQGGMPIISLPPIGLITYELGSLGAALGSIAGFLYLSMLPTMKDEVYDISVGADRFGIAVKDLDAQTYEAVSKILTKCGAASVEEKVGVLR